MFDPGVGDETVDVGRVLAAALDLLSGFGASQNKFLHDVTITDDGTTAYLANWDAVWSCSTSAIRPTRGGVGRHRPRQRFTRR